MTDMHVLDVAIQLTERGRTGLINAAGDIVTESTPVTPYRKGELRQKRRVTPLANGAKIVWSAGHAAVQNAGMARGRQFRQYTTSGTGRGFVQYGLDKVMPKLLEYFK